MKHLVLLSCLLFLKAGAPFAQTIDVLHYRFHIEVSDNHDTLYGKAEIKMALLEKTYAFPLSLTGINSKGKGMTVTAIDAPAHWAYRQEGEMVNITSERPFAAGDTVSFSIHYKGIPADGLIISRTKYGQRSFFADNWPDRGHNWLPCHDVPYDKASVEFIVTAPQHYQVVANGVQVEETNVDRERKRTHWKEMVPVSTKVMVIGVADFAVGLAGVVDNCIPVYSWVYPENRDKGFYDYALAMEILPFFIRNVGPYGYKKLANVQSKTTFGGLENANTIFYSESSVGGNRKSEALIAHEIAHQWFGNMATEKTFAHLWLSEGFATYMTILYLEHKYGKDTAVAMLEQDRREVIAHARTSNRPVVDTTRNYMELLNANSYQKGGWVLHMLRKELGDSLFWKGIRKYYSEYAGAVADSEDFQKAMESVSGKDLAVFFRQWLHTPGIPRIKVSWRYEEKKKELVCQLNQLQQEPFHFPLTIALTLRDGTVTSRTVTVDGPEKHFSIPSATSPVGVRIDPGTALLFEKAE